MLKVVVDTNLWIRALLGGSVTLPLLEAWQAGQFLVLVIAPLLAELDAVWQRPRLRPQIDPEQARILLEQLQWRGVRVTLATIPPGCRDPKDQPVLATAIDGHADAIVSGDGDLCADDALREAMTHYGIKIWGVTTFLSRVSAGS